MTGKLCAFHCLLSARASPRPANAPILCSMTPRPSLLQRRSTVFHSSQYHIPQFVPAPPKPNNTPKAAPRTRMQEVEARLEEELFDPVKQRELFERLAKYKKQDKGMSPAPVCHLQVGASCRMHSCFGPAHWISRIANWIDDWTTGLI